MSRRLLLAAFVISTTLGPPVNAQGPGFKGPVAGFVYSRDTRSVRPLLGVRGSAAIGPAILKEIDSASIAPGGGWAVVTREGRVRLLRGFSDAAPSEFSSAGLIDSVDRVVWSRSGSTALLYSSSSGQMQRIRLSARSAAADAAITLAQLGEVAALAIDPSGQRIALGITGTSAAGLYLSQAGGLPMLLSGIARPAAVAFDETGALLYAADLETQRIVRYDAATGTSDFTMLAEPGAPALSPVGLAVAGNGRYLLLADSTTRSVRVYETATRRLTDTIPLDFAPSCLEPLSAAPTFLLNRDNGTDWLLILDATDVPGVYFVPANRETGL